MGFLADWLATWRDYLVDGIPSSGKNNPDKAAVRALGGEIDAMISALQADDAVVVVRPFIGLPPPNTFGKDGEVAFDPSAKTLCGPKVSGAWPTTVVSLRGDPGPSAFGGTSTATVTIPTAGSLPVDVTFANTTPALAWKPGGRIRFAADASNWIDGVVKTYTGTTLVVTADTVGGFGSFSAWNLMPTGVPGGTGAPGASGGAISILPDYTNVGGQGDRATGSILVVTASAGLLALAASRLVDGSTTAPANATTFNAVAVAGQWIKFDFGRGAARIVSEFILTQNAAVAHGTWKLQGSIDDVTYVDIGASFTLGGVSGANTVTLSAANSIGYRFFRLMGISGTASSSAYLQEITFKIGSSVLDGAQSFSLTALASAVTASDADHTAAIASTAFVDRAVYRGRQIPAKFTSFFPVDEGTGTILHDVLGGVLIDLTTGGGTKGWSKGGHLQMAGSAWFKTPSLPAQVMGVLYRVPEGNTDVYFLSSPSGKALATSARGATASIPNARVLTGWGIHPITARANAAGTEIGELGAGGWTLAMATFVASETGTFIVGAGNASGSGASAATWEVAGIFFASSDPTDAECRQLLNAIRPGYKGRNIYLSPFDCPQRRVLAIVEGESTGEGTFLLSGLTTAQQATFSQTAFVNAYNAASATTTGKLMKRANFNVTAGTQNNNAPSTNTKFGAEFGVMNARNARPDDGRFLDVLKVAQGSTYLLPAGTYTGADGNSVTLTVSQVRSSDNLGDVSNGTGLFYTLEARNVFKAEQQARNRGIGYTTVCFFQPDGINDAFIGNNAITSAAQYQGYLQNQHNARLAMYGMAAIYTTYLKPHHPNGPANTLGGVDTTYPNNSTGSNRQAALEFIRTAIDNLVAANPTCSKLDGDTYALNAASPDLNVHPNAAGYDAMGQAWEALIPYTVEVQAAV